jgi:2-oxoglutarate dehydrogenase E2 component (dihydrolipoamide succinyltransferase)
MTSDQEFGSPPPDGGAPASDREARDPEPAAEPVDEPTGESAEAPDAATTLSPAVRRLVRQYDLDVTGIHGTGPSGRIRVGDVMALLAGRTESEQDRESGAAREAVPVEAFDEPMGTPYRAEMTDVAPAAVASAGAVPITTVFECDLSRVLSHRKQRRQENAEALLTSYYIVACGEALKLVPEAVPPQAGPRFGVLLDSPDGVRRTALVDGTDEQPLGSIDDRLQAVDRALRIAAPPDLASATLLIHQHGASGSLIATPTPIGHGHSASLGLGRVRREIVVRNVNGEEAPRVAALSYVSLSFYPERLELHRANRFLAQLVRVLEQWPD